MSDEQKPIKFGLWTKISNSGNRRLAGKTNVDIPAGSYFNVFKNDRRRNDRDPEYNVVVNPPREAAEQAQGGASEQTAGDDIPF